MTEIKIPIHYVCTLDKARELIEANKAFFISNCGCREGSGHQCKRSRIDVCLNFDPDDTGSGSELHPATLKDAQAILEEARAKYLVARPFRNAARDATSGICFCCDDCCGYFASPDEVCDKGELIASTDREICTDCGICVDYCNFHARIIDGGELKETLDNCYGCGLCVMSCPEECIEMVARG